MNLSIEYLIRTDAIREFFAVPCTLCIEHWLGAKTIIGIEKSDHISFLVTHWFLEELDETGRLPKSQVFSVPKNSIFTSNKIILAGEYVLLPYREQPIATAHNRYSNPMNEDAYQSFVNGLLNSSEHQVAREEWLWRSFVKAHIGQPLLSLYVYESKKRVINLEQRVVYEHYTDKWRLWRAWRKQLLKSKKVAPELIFHQSYN